MQSPQDEARRELKRRLAETCEFPTNENAESMVAEQKSLFLRSPAFWVLLAITAFGVAVMIVAALGTMSPWIPIPRGGRGRIILSLAVAPGVAACMWWNAVRIWRRRFERHLRERREARGIPVCHACGYDLRGLRELRCPECGRPFDAPDDEKRRDGAG